VIVARNAALAEAKPRLSELLARVTRGGERIVVERHGKPIAGLVAVDDLLERAGDAAVDPPPRAG